MNRSSVLRWAKVNPSLIEMFRNRLIINYVEIYVNIFSPTSPRHNGFTFLELDKAFRQLPNLKVNHRELCCRNSEVDAKAYHKTHSSNSSNVELFKYFFSSAQIIKDDQEKFSEKTFFS